MYLGFWVSVFVCVFVCAPICVSKCLGLCLYLCGSDRLPKPSSQCRSAAMELIFILRKMQNEYQLTTTSSVEEAP